jgi:hypothetical protein
MRQQLEIVPSVKARFKSSLFDIRQLVMADLLDSELEAASELAKMKFLRAAGAVAGVVLEKHLHQVCDNHSVTVAKKDPGISHLNDLLEESGCGRRPAVAGNSIRRGRAQSVRPSEGAGADS